MSDPVAFYKDLSDVDVTFHDGEIKTYRITANPSVSGHLARQAAETGILNLYNDDESVCIPIANVREFALRKIPIETTKEKTE